MSPTELPITAEEFITEVNSRLRMYGDNRHFNKADPLDELIFIILSAQTESYSYLETYRALRTRFPTRRSLYEARVSSISATIKRGGLSKKKAVQLKGVLTKIFNDTGKLSLSFLSRLGDDEVERYLVSLPGVGIKSARCIMMYSLNRKVFPVDTHVWRVCRRLGLTQQVAKPTPAMEHDLQEKILPDLRYTLHVNLVSHGREICTPYWPKCDRCILNDLCPSAFKPDEVWGQFRKPKGAWQNYSKVNRNQ